MIPQPFTPQQMRERAAELQADGIWTEAADMLRFAADHLDQPQPETVQTVIHEWREQVRRLRAQANCSSATQEAVLTDCADRLESLLTQSPQRGWQPISSAPKDGTRVLAFFRDRNPARDWQPDEERHVADILYWTDHNGGGWCSYHPGKPTHWMPLPAPPVDTEPT